MITSRADHGKRPSGLCRRPLSSALAVTAGVLLSMGCAGQHPAGPVAQLEQGTGKSSETSLVECVLPSQVRRLDRQVVHLSPSRRVQTSASDCEARGGSPRDSGGPVAASE